MGIVIKLNTREKCTRKCGGIIIIIIYKSQIDKFLEFPVSKSSFVQWLRINNYFLNILENLVIGCVYVPPENTKYSSPEAFDEMESVMFQIVKEGEYTGILGDCNAKTGNLLDYVETTEALLDIFYLDHDVDLNSVHV